MLLVYTQQNAFVAVNHFCDKTRSTFRLHATLSSNTIRYNYDKSLKKTLHLFFQLASVGF